MFNARLPSVREPDKEASPGRRRDEAEVNTRACRALRASRFTADCVISVLIVGLVRDAIVLVEALTSVPLLRGILSEDLPFGNSAVLSVLSAHHFTIHDQKKLRQDLKIDGHHDICRKTNCKGQKCKILIWLK